MKLSSCEIKEELQNLPTWSHRLNPVDAIERKLVFENFDDAFDFMKQVAQEAKSEDHHPEWFNVDIVLSTHDVKGISVKDIKMAKFIDEIAKVYGGK